MLSASDASSDIAFILSSTSPAGTNNTSVCRSAGSAFRRSAPVIPAAFTPTRAQARATALVAIADAIPVAATTRASSDPGVGSTAGSDIGSGVDVGSGSGEGAGAAEILGSGVTDRL